MSGSLFLEKGGKEEEVEISRRSPVGRSPVGAFVARIRAETQRHEIEQNEGGQEAKQEHNSSFHCVAILYWLPDPAGAVHDAMNIVADSIGCANAQFVEPSQLAVGGRVGHGIPIHRVVGLLRRQTNNKSLTSKYKSHLRPPLSADRAPNAVRVTCRLPLCPALFGAPRQTQIERVGAVRVRSNQGQKRANFVRTIRPMKLCIGHK